MCVLFQILICKYWNALQKCYSRLVVLHVAVPVSFDLSHLSHIPFRPQLHLLAHVYQAAYIGFTGDSASRKAAGLMLTHKLLLLHIITWA